MTVGDASNLTTVGEEGGEDVFYVVDVGARVSRHVMS